MREWRAPRRRRGAFEALGIAERFALLLFRRLARERRDLESSRWSHATIVTGRISMTDKETPEDPWTAWVEAKYALADLRWAEARLDISPMARGQLREAIDRAAQEIASQLAQLRENPPQQGD
jgi:hypothetical protein